MQFESLFQEENNNLIRKIFNFTFSSKMERLNNLYIMRIHFKGNKESTLLKRTYFVSS